MKHAVYSSSSSVIIGGAPVGKAARGVNVGSSRISVVDLRRKKLDEAFRGFSRRRE